MLKFLLELTFSTMPIFSLIFPAGEDEQRATEEKLWELCQTFKEKSLVNLILVHNIVATMTRGDYDTAKYAGGNCMMPQS